MATENQDLIHLSEEQAAEIINLQKSWQDFNITDHGSEVVNSGLFSPKQKLVTIKKGEADQNFKWSLF